MLNLISVTVITMTLFSGIANANCGAGDLNCDGRVTGEEAWESGQPYRDAVNAVRVPAPSEGLPSLEDMGYPKQQHSQGNGVWEKLSRQPIDIASFIVLSGDSAGYTCSPSGVYGRQPYENCIHVGNGDFNCKTYVNYYICK